MTSDYKFLFVSHFMMWCYRWINNFFCVWCFSYINGINDDDGTLKNFKFKEKEYFYPFVLLQGFVIGLEWWRRMISVIVALMNKERNDEKVIQG